MATLMVPLDGSDKDERALSIAARLAEVAGADFHLIHVLTPPVDSLSERAKTFGALDSARQARGNAEESLKGGAHRLTRETGRTVAMEIAEGFDVADVLVDRATRLGDLVVMATRAPSAVGRAICGSVADRVMRESPHPVVLVPPGATNRLTEPFRLQRVLVPLDGSRLARSAIDYLLGLECARQLDFILLEVVLSDLAPLWDESTPALQPYGGSLGVTSARVEAELRLSEVAGQLRANGVREVAIRVGVARQAAPVIAAAAVKENADLIAMTTRGASGFKRFILGSVTEELLRESQAPVLLIPPKDE